MQIDKAMNLAKKKIKSNLAYEAEMIYVNILRQFPKNKRVKAALEKLRRDYNLNNQNSSPPMEQISEVIKLMSQSRLDSALLNIKTLLALYPNSTPVKTILGGLYVRMENYDLAIETFNHLLELQPNNADTYYNLAGALKFKGDTVAAIKNYKNAIKHKPQYTMAYHELGDIYKSTGQLQKSKHWYEKGIEIEPSYAALHNNLGNVVAELGDTVRAVTLFKNAITIEPGYSDAWKNFGSLLALLKCQNRFDENYLVFGSEVTVSLDFKIPFSILKLALSEKGATYEEAFVDVIHLMAQKENRTIQNPNFSNFKANRRAELFDRVIVLQHFGRSGTGLLHSLVDGHPEISTMPSIYFSEYFNESMWSDITSSGWDEMVDKFIENYDVLFDASSKKPVRSAEKLIFNLGAKEGLTTVGENNDQILRVDKIQFKEEFNELLKNYESINALTFLKIVQKAYDIVTGQGSNKRVFFYHIHNPKMYSKLNFLSHEPNAQWLVMVREPIQSCESWIKGNVKNNDLKGCYDRILAMLHEIDSVVYNDSSFGVRLEDIKSNSDRALSALCGEMGIEVHDTLYEMTAQGEKWWGDKASPDYKTDGMNPFGKKSISRKVGSIFSERDQFILRTLFYPFSVRFGYQQENLQQFLLDLKNIRPMLDDVFDFEKLINNHLDENVAKFDDTLAGKKFRAGLIKHWNLLNQLDSFKKMIRPMIVN